MKIPQAGRRAEEAKEGFNLGIVGEKEEHCGKTQEGSSHFHQLRMR